jgi:hypothetical protein
MPELAPWPMWNQMNDWTTDVDKTDENRENNCGPESVASCLKYLTGIELPADFIKDVMRGQAYMGYTFVSDLVKFLQEKSEIPCQVHSGDGRTQLQPVVRAAIDAGNPIIVLFFWDINLPESGHFSPVIGYQADGCTRHNVWGGKREFMPWPMFEAWQKFGTAITLKRTRAKDLGVGVRGAVRVDPLTQRVLTLKAEADAWEEANPLWHERLERARAARSVEE